MSKQFDKLMNDGVILRNSLSTTSTVDADSEEVFKKYYMSGKDLELSAADAMKVCKSMNMKLASPRNQDEYNNLRDLMLWSNERIEQVHVEIYRSTRNESVWMTGGSNVNFNIVFEDGQPDNYKGKENCLMFTGFLAYSNDYPCDLRARFICEQTQYAKAQVHDRKEALKFIQPIASYGYEVYDRVIRKNVFVNQEYLKASWIDAQLICRSYGMNLLTFESEFEDLIVRKNFKESSEQKLLLNLPRHFHVGVTKVGSTDWYSIASNKSLDYDINWKSTDESDEMKNCAMMENDEGTFVYESIDCALLETNFLCQEKLTNKLNIRNLDGDSRSFYYDWLYEQSKLGVGFKLKQFLFVI